ncbi:hypothetical protein ASE92_06510 [Pedobacter sp. Leaf41]|uniref:hypothetical protein n=1 Tax=Pedobacter sp. Leaf41 TaxID=1736218 RepID=UPI00070309CF|nr:hypothetical protein [Pedobacter sp. Leaf41]KQN35793.1 hypothetical protein ASE92_06510 [Pedobacter sp. Leaf41]
MSCNHKFYEFLNLDRLDFKPNTLIIGTFNPEWPENNQAEWFYGRTHDSYGKPNNNFWDVLPRVYGEDSLINNHPTKWKDFCRRNKIAITDLITTIDDAYSPKHDKLMGSYSDANIATKFNNHIVTDIVNLLQNHSTIKNIYLTRGSGSFWNSLWQPIKVYAVANGLHATQILTPSKFARFAMFPFNRENPQQTFNMASLNNFILYKWQQQWHDLKSSEE